MSLGMIDSEVKNDEQIEP